MEETATLKAGAGSRGFIARVFSTNHRTIARQYFFLSLVAVLLGTALSLAMRFHLIYPNAALLPASLGGDVMAPEYYLSMLTLHGTIMVFFVLTLAPVSAFGNLVLPEQLGAKEMAFPRLNMVSFWMTVAAFGLLIASFLATGGGPLSGWTAYPPLSAVGAAAGPGEGLGQTLWFFSLTVFSIASVMTSVNIVTTVTDQRAPGMTPMRMPITCWNWFITAILMLLAFSVLFAALLLILCDRLGGTSFFVPEGLQFADQAIQHSGGSPLLWEHLFWFFGHPEVYIAILPGMGIVTHLIATFSRKPVFGYKAMVWASISIAFLGLLVWGHHMFVSGLNPYSAVLFSLITMTIGAPSAVKTFNWIATAWNGRLQLTTAMLFALGFVSVFVTGGLSGLFLGQPEIDAYFHGTYFVVAHFHLIMGIAALFGIFAATFYWFPVMFGRMMDERLGKLHFYLTFIGAYATFLPMHFAGIAGDPRRYADFTSFDFLAQAMPLQRWITFSAFALAGAQSIFLWNLFHSMWRGAKAERNPWQSTSLEWAEHEGPVVRGAYEFSQPQLNEESAARDYVMQNDV